MTLDGAPAAYDDGRIALPDLGATNTVRVTARMPYVTDGDGMTATIDPADGERYVCAYTAMDIAQKVIPCFDQPDIKTTFTVSVTAPAHWTVLANGVLAGREGDTWSFETTPPISVLPLLRRRRSVGVGDVGRALRPGARRDAALRLARARLAGA